MKDLVTERLILRPLTEVHARAIMRVGNRSPRYPSAADIEAAGDFLALCARTGNPYPFGSYEVRLRSTGEPIGYAGFNRPLDADGVSTVGYGLVETARGHGYATEAVKALLAMARSRGASQIRGSAHVDNVASQKVMLAAGMGFLDSDDHERFYAMTW
ncbi:GNAT family N-acetyltransferase [Kocuria coralli]|uniref:GNAT family N-acetyltransferase n=1 Tax=Kocuria coralli TaxID=1461025 RepID=A0A5J5KXB1_9MICC|nr:GNAT family N-acetyltransferase [Kocuria coralli]KAA9393920.1 GNAT family N-acetyltransferase [Kocuria coralli]